jgi:hypothetical protein
MNLIAMKNRVLRLAIAAVWLLFATACDFLGDFRVDPKFMVEAQYADHGDVEIHCYGDNDYSLRVSWGDGTPTEYVSCYKDWKHRYVSNGMYSLKIREPGLIFDSTLKSVSIGITTAVSQTKSGSDTTPQSGFSGALIAFFGVLAALFGAIAKLLGLFGASKREG